ncbi:MAG: DUF3090 family protein [Acidimicrobiales bacterium]
MSDPIDLPSSDAVTVGTVGEPGQRVFLFQARLGATQVTLKIEKQQAAALAEAIQALLADLPDHDLAPRQEIAEPTEPLWTVGAMALSALDEATGHVTIVVREFVREEGDVAAAASATFGVTAGQLARLGQTAAELVTGGRPSCELCGFPIDPSGHSCPKTNGHLKH